MSEKPFSNVTALQFGWRAVSGNLQYFINLCVLVFAGTYVPNIVLKLLSKLVPEYIRVALGIANLLWQLVLSMLVIRVCLRLYDGRSDLMDLWDSKLFTSLINFAGTALLITLSISPFALLAFIAIESLPIFKWQILLLCALPALAVLMRVYFASFLVVDRNVGPTEAFRSIWVTTKGLSARLSGLAILIIVVLGLGHVIGLIGMAIAYPVTMLALTSAYRQLVPLQEADPRTAAVPDLPLDPRPFI
jgi:hypothetical protein